MTTERATARVLMSPALMAEWASRSENGNRIVWDWGEPDADGFYEPTITVDYSDNLADEAARKERERIVAAVNGLAADDGHHPSCCGACDPCLAICPAYHGAERRKGNGDRRTDALDSAAILAAITDTGEGSAS